VSVEVWVEEVSVEVWVEEVSVEVWVEEVVEMVEAVAAVYYYEC
jgi:hypothetical protein